MEALEALRAIVGFVKGCLRLLQVSELLQLLPCAVQRWDDADLQSRAVHSVVRLLDDAWNVLLRSSVKTSSAVTGAEQEKEQFTSEQMNGHVQQEQFMEDGEDGYDDDYYDDGYEEKGEYSDEEEKSKVRKKRKLEAKNRKAAKKAKLEIKAVANKQNDRDDVTIVLTKSNSKKIDFLLICNIVQCLFLLINEVFKSRNEEVITLYEKLVNSITEYTEANMTVKKKAFGMHVNLTLATLRDHIKLLYRRYEV